MNLERPVERMVWELRAAWARRTKVRLTLSEKCILRTVIGPVQRMSVTGAFAVVDGWEIPCDEILSIGNPTLEETEAYATDRVRVLDDLLAERTANMDPMSTDPMSPSRRSVIDTSEPLG